MTQEDKQLLRKDLYARQYYGVKVSLGLDRMNEYIEPEVENVLTLYYINPQRLECVFKECWWTAYIGAIRPYLRPMSSMTEKERMEFTKLFDKWHDDELFDYIEEGVEFSIWKHNGISPVLFDWLNKNHFDYRGLIEKGLALEAPEGMYNIKTE